MYHLCLCGWIQAEGADEAPFLESLGITLGTWLDREKTWRGCRVPMDALKALDPYWGRFYWGLTPEAVA